MKPIKLGIFGLWRGAAFIPIIDLLDEAVLHAVCDRDETRVAEVLPQCPAGVRICRDFDELLDSGIDGVLLCNYFHEHADYAIRAMERGIHVFSECTTAVTMKDCVRMCEVAEATGVTYMIAENYPFSAAMLEVSRVCHEGSLGRVLYAEGEYNHAFSREDMINLSPGENHWRRWIPPTYYVTHSLGPLMYATGQFPVEVSAFAVRSDVIRGFGDFVHGHDALAMMTCRTDDGALFRFSGWSRMAGHTGYRVAGEQGSCETGRTLGGQVNVTYNAWHIPEGMEATQTYTPDWPANGEMAERAGHGGGDFWTVYNFVDAIVHNKKPFFDIYCGCCMAAVAILGWRSCLENGKVYAIPDFRDKAARDLWRDDDLTPFPDKNGHTTLPSALPETR